MPSTTWLCLLVLLFQGGEAQIRTTKFLTVGVEDPDVFALLTLLTSDANLFKAAFPYVGFTGITLNFTYLPVRGALENVSSVDTVVDNLNSMKISAVISDYYLSLAIATFSLKIPYFLIRRYVFTSQLTGTPNIFEIEITNYHMGMALYDISVVYRRTDLVVVSDGTPLSSQFLVNFDGRVFRTFVVDNTSTDSDIYSVFSRFNPSSLSSGMAWILLFDEPSLPLMERTLEQASRAGIFVQKQFFFLPSLFDKQSYLTRFYRSDIQIYTFSLRDKNPYSRLQLLQPFVLDCLNHYLNSYHIWIGMESSYSILDALAKAPSIQNPRTGYYAYDPVYFFRASVQIDVLLANSSRPTSSIYSLAGSWQATNDLGLPSYQPNYSGADDVSQSRILIVAFQSVPYFYGYNNETSSARGLGMEIIDNMRSQLGFEYKLLVAANEKEALQLIKEGTADVTLNFLEPSEDRLKYADPSTDMVQDGVQMLSVRLIRGLNFLQIFRPFSVYVWLSILLAIAVLSATLYACDRISPSSEGKPMFTPFKSFFLVLSSFFMSKVETDTNRLSTRLFTLLLWFSTLMYMTTYLCALVAFIIQADEQISLSGVGDLENLKGYKWGFIRDSLVDAEVMENWPKVFRRAQKEWPKEMYFESIEDAVDRVLSDPNYILLHSSDTLGFIKTTNCKLVVVGNIGNSHQLTWLFRKGFRFAKDLNNQLLSKKDGEFAQLRSKYFDLNRCYSGPTDIENKVALDFKYCSGLFVILGLGLGLGFLQLFGHWVFNQLREWWKIWHQKVHFQPGRFYAAEVYDAKPNGLWIRIHGESEVRFMDNSCLHQENNEFSERQNSNLRGETIQVQYVGVCGLTGAKVFVRQPGVSGSVYTVQNSAADSGTTIDDSA